MMYSCYIPRLILRSLDTEFKTPQATENDEKLNRHVLGPPTHKKRLLDRMLMGGYSLLCLALAMYLFGWSIFASVVLLFVGIWFAFHAFFVPVVWAQVHRIVIETTDGTIARAWKDVEHVSPCPLMGSVRIEFADGSRIRVPDMTGSRGRLLDFARHAVRRSRAEKPGADAPSEHVSLAPAE